MAGAVLAIVLWGLPLSAGAETKTVVAEGTTEACWGTRELGLRFAWLDAENAGRVECRALGPDWRFSSNRVAGYEQCTQCGDGQGFRCKVTQAMYHCINQRKEAEDKAAKARLEKEAAEKAAKGNPVQGNAAQGNATKGPAVNGNAGRDARTPAKAEAGRTAPGAGTKPDQAANPGGPPPGLRISEAFSNLEQQTGRAPAAPAGSIDSAFGKMERDRVELERARVAAEKATLAREAAVQFCQAAFRARESCVQNTCGAKPAETTCTEQREVPRPRCVPQKPGDCRATAIVLPTYTCVATGPNPAYTRWSSCMVGTANQCSASEAVRGSEEECVTQRLRAGQGR